MTSAGRAYVPVNPDNSGYPCYTGGIDAHSSRGWVMRRNHFEGIYCDSGLAEHAIHFWHTGRDQLIEQNTFINNARHIGLGLTDGTGFNERPYADSPHAADKMGNNYAGNYDGIIRNNFLYADVSAFDCGVCLEQAMGTKVLSNTVVVTGAASGNAIEYRFINSLVTISNNISTNIMQRDNGRAIMGMNQTSPPLAQFVDAAGGDLHLAASASGAIDQGAVLADVTDDIDGDARGTAPDLGADER
jgi:hypothetical protein